MAGDLLDGAVDAAELVADLDNGEADHARVEAQQPADFGLDFDAAIELHDEVVALVVLGLVFHGRPGQVELAPVLDAPDHASVVDDLLAADTGDSGKRKTVSA